MKINFLLIIFFCYNIIIAKELDSLYYFKNNIKYKDKSFYDSQYKEQKCVLDIALPKLIKNFQTIIWFQGGGLTGGEKYYEKELLNGKNCIVSVGYRLYPNANINEILDDAAAAVKYIHDNINKYGGNKNKIILSGHSAGGYITLMIGMDSSYLSRYNLTPQNLKMLIPLSPQTITHFTIRKFKGIPEGQIIVDSLAPMYYVNRKHPPIHLICGDKEMELFGRFEESQYFIKMLKFNGNENSYLYELQGFDHGDMVAP